MAQPCEPAGPVRLDAPKQLSYSRIIMPTVLRIKGFEFRIYTDDHAPEHCHVHKAGTEIVIARDPVTIRQNKGMSKPNAREAVSLAEKHQALLLSAWKKIHEDE